MSSSLLLANNPKVVPYVDMPASSTRRTACCVACRRGHGGKRQRNVVERLRNAAVPGLVFRTAFIVGHPGRVGERIRRPVRVRGVGEVRLRVECVFPLLGRADGPRLHARREGAPQGRPRPREAWSRIEDSAAPSASRRTARSSESQLDVLVRGTERRERARRSSGATPDRPRKSTGGVYLSRRRGPSRPDAPGDDHPRDRL